MSNQQQPIMVWHSHYKLNSVLQPTITFYGAEPKPVSIVGLGL